MADTQTFLPKLLTTPGGHEKEVRNLFPDSFAYAGDAPEFKTPLVLLGFFNRSGSNLLGSHLRGLKGVGGFKEHLNHPVIRNVSARQGMAGFPDYFRNAQAKHAKARGHIHGFKASWDQILMLKRARIDRMYQGMRLMHILREDVISQAISLVIAQQTQQWTSEQSAKADVEPVYDAAQIGRAMQVCYEAEMRIRMLAQFLELPYLQINYETLVSDPAVVMARIGDFIGRDLSDWAPEEVAIKRQTTSRNSEWRDRFLADTGAELTGAVGAGKSVLSKQLAGQKS